jgi:hypothetical protein
MGLFDKSMHPMIDRNSRPFLRDRFVVEITPKDVLIQNTVRPIPKVGTERSSGCPGPCK